MEQESNGELWTEFVKGVNMLDESMYHVWIPKKKWLDVPKKGSSYSVRSLFDKMMRNKNNYTAYMRTAEEITSMITDGYVLVGISDALKPDYVKACSDRGMKIAFMRCKEIRAVKATL